MMRRTHRPLECLLRSLWRRLWGPGLPGSPGRRRGPSPRARCRPALEALEDRCVLSPIAKVADLGTGTVTSGTTISIPVAAAVAAGNTILVEVTDDANTVPGVTDGSNSYTQDVFLTPAPAAPSVFIFSARVGTALTTANHITVTFSATVAGGAASAAVFSGLAVAPQDLHSDNSGTGNTVTSGATAITTAANELLLGAVSGRASDIGPPSFAFSAGTGYTALASTTSSHSSPPFYSNLGIFPEFQLVRATAPYAATGTLTAASIYGAVTPSWSAAIVTYKAADQTTHFAVTSSTATPQAGVPFTVTVTALDGANATSTAYTGTVHLASSDPAAGLPADFTFPSGSGGTHTFTNVVLRSAGSQTVSAADTNPAAGQTGTSAPLNVQPTHFGVVPSTATPQAGVAFSVTVTALNAGNATVAGYTGTVGLSSGDPQASLPAAFTFTGGEGGAHTFANLVLRTAGSATVTATDTVAAAITGTAAVTVGSSGSPPSPPSPPSSPSPSPSPSVSVAIGPFGQVLEVVSPAGVLTQYDAFGAHRLLTGVRSASVAFTPFGEALEVVALDGTLSQYDAWGAHRILSGVRSAAAAFGPFGEVLAVVAQDGTLTLYDAFGAHRLFGGLNSAAVTYGPYGEVLDVVGQDNTLTQFDAFGAHRLFGGVASAGVAFGPFGEVLDVLAPDGTLTQYDAFGAHNLGKLV